ncbi:hypothetical protein [Brevundimonas sp. PAMC22021]|uniref:hypothetical protein n=1 Tax=Brevundimonas sp. PAMC22021 TaxID=2861285 RepID=UPI001C62E0E2|nr:hypothetical protein [Brevundimonas sp. PAMC22021]QYF87410.1 hypothetical protein KY493_02580 [Brevundimonas sp. PAMC22021]
MTIRTWVLMLAGLSIWALHFIGVYLIASVADVVATADDFAWRMGGVAFSVACALLCGAAIALPAMALRRGTGAEVERFSLQLGVLGGAIGLIGIVYQTLPNLIGY